MFLGWYNGDTLYDFTSPVTEDLNLTAKWQIIKYTVTFDTDGGSAVESIKVNGGSAATKPQDPAKEGYIFLGWYNGEAAYNFSSVISADLTLVAKWEKEPPKDTEIYNKMQSVLLIGQSNMSGRGDLNTVDPISDDRLFMMRGDRWMKMKEPLHTDSLNAGAGIGASFGKAFVETFDVQLGLIPAAVGGTNLDRWAVGGDLYTEAVRLAKIAQETSDICAILWHQGESNQGTEDYAERLKVILDAMMAELGLDPDKVVIITGELFGTRGDKVHTAQLEKMASYYKNYGVAYSDGLTVFDVTTHFDAQSLRVFGYRYFDVFYNCITGKHYEFDQNPENYYKPQEQKPDENEDGIIASFDFNDFETGVAASFPGEYNVSPQGGSIMVEELTPTEKQISITTGFKDTQYGTSYMDVYNKAAAGSVIVVEAKFKRGEEFNAAADLIKVIGVNNAGVYKTVRVDANGKLYNVLSGNNALGEYLGYDLDYYEWTKITVVLDLKNNLKEIYVNDKLIIKGVAIATTDTSTVDISHTRVVQFNGSSKVSTIIIDDFKASFYDKSLNSGEEKPNDIASADFNNLTAGTVYTSSATVDSLSFSQVTASSTISVESDGDNKYLSFNRGSDNKNVYADLKGNVSEKTKFIIEGKFKLGANAQLSADLLKMTPKSGSFNLIYLKSNGELCDVNNQSEAFGMLSSDKWTSIKIVVDLEKNTKDIYIDDVLVKSGLAVYDASITDTALTKCRIVHIKGGSGSLYVDDIRFYYA